MIVKCISDLKLAIRQGPYAFPGGYPFYFIAGDGEPLSFKTVMDNFKLVASAIKHQHDKQWEVVAMDVNWEEPALFCAHTNQRIESAYAEEDVVFSA